MAIAVTNDASAFKRSANVPSQTAMSLWGWFNFSSVTPARFWGPLGIYAGTDGSPSGGGGSSYFQISSTASGSASLSLFYPNGSTAQEVAFFTASANTWYFIAITCSALSTGNVKAHVRAITANTLTTVSSTNTSDAFTSARTEWGRDSFTGDFISGSIHACGSADAALSVEELLELSYFHEPQLDGIRSINTFYPCIAATAANCQVDKSGNARDATATPGALADSPPLLWRTVGPQIVLPAAGGGANLSLDIDAAGAITLAGQSLTVAIGAALSTQGAITLAGQSVTPALTIPISAGVITLAGQSTTFSTATALANGQITLAGQDVTLANGANLSLTIDTAGAITLAGQSATFGTSTTLSNGSITLAGQSSTFATSTALANGQITLVGQSVALDLGSSLSVEIDVAGQITLAGQSVTLVDSGAVFYDVRVRLGVQRDAALGAHDPIILSTHDGNIELGAYN